MALVWVLASDLVTLISLVNITNLHSSVMGFLLRAIHELYFLMNVITVTFSCEILALYKLLSYLLTYILTHKS